MCLAYKNDKYDLMDCFDKTQALGKHAKWNYLKVSWLIVSYLKKLNKLDFLKLYPSCDNCKNLARSLDQLFFI